MPKLEQIPEKIWDMLPQIITVVIIFAVAYFANSIIKKSSLRISKKFKIDITAVKYILNILSALIWFVAIIMALDKLGFPVSSALTLFAAVGAAAALAVKENLSNMASGLVLIFTKPFSSGDVVEINSVVGKVREIKLMHTNLVTFQNEVISVANTTMITATITNFSAHEFLRRDYKISVPYGADIGAAKTAILNMANGEEKISKQPEAPFVFIDELADSSVVLALRIWLKSSDVWTANTYITEKMRKAVNEIGIDVPFNQLDVRVVASESKTAD